MTQKSFVIVDVFAETPFAGNQLAVFTDPAPRARIEGELDLHGYALVSLQEAQRVLGFRHPCFRKRPRSLLQRVRRRRNGQATLRI